MRIVPTLLLILCGLALMQACATTGPERFSWDELARTAAPAGSSVDSAPVAPATAVAGNPRTEIAEHAGPPELDTASWLAPEFELGNYRSGSMLSSPPQSTPSQRLRDADGWFLEIAPAFWITKLNATLELKNTPNRLEADLPLFDAGGGGQIGFDAMRSDWGYWVTLSYVKMTGEVSTNQGPGDIDFESATAEFALTLLWEGPNLEYFLGGRWEWLDMDLRIPTNPQESADTSWIEPFFGARWKNHITDWVRFYFRGDIGGFGAGSDLAWNLYALFQFQLSETWSIDVGYRALDVLLDRASFKYDGRISGILLGGTFYW